MSVRLRCALSAPLLGLSLAAGAGCGAAPSPGPAAPVTTTAAETRPAPAAPARDASQAPGEEPAPATTALPAGAPFFGTYEVTEIVKAGGEVEKTSGLDACDVKDCIIHRRAYAFEGTTLRIRYLLVSVAETQGDVSMTTVCDAQTTIDVQWDGEAMIVPTTVVAKANSDVVRRTQRASGPGKFKVDWESDHLGCTATLRAGRYVVRNVSSEKRGVRPARLVLASPEQRHVLEAAEEAVDVKAAINEHFGQR